MAISPLLALSFNRANWHTSILAISLCYHGWRHAIFRMYFYTWTPGKSSTCTAVTRVVFRIIRGFLSCHSTSLIMLSSYQSLSSAPANNALQANPTFAGQVVRVKAVLHTLHQSRDAHECCWMEGVLMAVSPSSADFSFISF